MIGVLGNNDGEKLGLLKAANEAGADISEGPREIVIGGRSLLLLHGFGDPDFTRRIVYALASSKRWDAILYGHTHKWEIAYYGGTLILNPGDGGGSLYPPTAAILDLKRMRAEIIEV